MFLEAQKSLLPRFLLDFLVLYTALAYPLKVYGLLSDLSKMHPFNKT